MANVHYIAMSGIHGCLPQYCASHSTIRDAVEDLATLHEIGKNRQRTLRHDLYLELNSERDGAEYCEIAECDCDDPDCHNDV